MDEKTKRSLIAYRLEKAHTDLSAAIMSFDAGFYDASANRSYYAIFHAARAVLMLNGQDYKKHSGVISRFSEQYLKTKILPPELSKIISMASIIRNRSDYEDFYICSISDTKKLVSDAALFLDTVTAFLETQYNE